MSELIIAMGAAQHLAARTDYDTHPRLEGLPSVGGGLDPSLEALVAEDVDVVLTTSSRETAALAGRLAELGIETAVLSTNTLGDVFEAVRRLGALLGVEAAADSLAGVLRGGLDVVRASVEGLDEPTVVYVVGFDPPITSGGGTFIDELMEVAGGRNAFGDLPTGWPSVGFESLVERDPDVVIWPASDVADPLGFVRSLPGWRDLRAVREGRVLFVDAESMNRPGPGLVASAETLARALHPEVF